MRRAAREEAVGGVGGGQGGLQRVDGVHPNVQGHEDQSRPEQEARGPEKEALWSDPHLALRSGKGQRSPDCVHQVCT